MYRCTCSDRERCTVVPTAGSTLLLQPFATLAYLFQVFHIVLRTFDFLLVHKVFQSPAAAHIDRESA